MINQAYNGDHARPCESSVGAGQSFPLATIDVETSVH